MHHERYLDMTLEEAEFARNEGSVPVGSVIIASDGRVIGHGRNRVTSQGDQTAHAEIDAIRSAGRPLSPATPGTISPVSPGSGYILYTSAEPCLMCLGAILFCPIETIVWAATSVTGGAYDAVLGSGYQSQRLTALKVIREPSPEHRLRSRALLREYYEKLGNGRLARLLQQP